MLYITSSREKLNVNLFPIKTHKLVYLNIFDLKFVPQNESILFNFRSYDASCICLQRKSILIRSLRYYFVSKFLFQNIDTFLQTKIFLWIYMNSLQALFPSFFAYWKLRTENTEKLCARFPKENPYLYNENPFSSWRSKLESCTWIKSRLKPERICRSRFRSWLAVWATERQRERARRYIYICNIYLYVYIYKDIER